MGRNSIHKIKKGPRHSVGAPIVLLEDETDLFDRLESVENPLVLVLEGVQDPHNLGACLRTASGAGVDAVIAPKKGSCGITDTVRDIACGGAEDVPFLKVGNLGQTLRKLKDMGFSLVGTTDRGHENLYQADFSGPLVFVFGSEGWGLRKKTAELCDHLVRIPMAGRVDCLNVSVSAAVCLYEAVRQRMP